MAVAFVASETNTIPDSDPDPFSIGMPAGTTEGMAMVAFVSAFDVPFAFPGDGWDRFASIESSPTEPSPPSEFDPSAWRFAAYVKVVESGDTGPWEFVAAGSWAAGGIATFSGVDTSEPLADDDDANETTYTNTLVLPSLTAPRSGCMLVGGVGCSWEPASWSSPMTEMWDVVEVMVGVNAVNAAGYEPVGAGATGSRAFTASAAVFSAGAICVLQPPRPRSFVGFVGHRS